MVWISPKRLDSGREEVFKSIDTKMTMLREHEEQDLWVLCSFNIYSNRSLSLTSNSVLLHLLGGESVLFGRRLSFYPMAYQAT